jgi:hypothetical protein
MLSCGISTQTNVNALIENWFLLASEVLLDRRIHKTKVTFDYAWLVLIQVQNLEALDVAAVSVEVLSWLLTVRS